MGLGERVNKIWNDFKLGLAKGLVYGAGIGVLGCGGDGGGGPVIEIPATTKVLDAPSGAVLESDIGGVLTFLGSTEQLDSLMPGDAYISDINSITPNGFIREVNSIYPASGDVIVETIPTTLEEAIKTGSTSVSKSLTSADVKSKKLMKGISPKTGDFNLGINNVVLYDLDGNLTTTNDQIVANGDISFDPSFDFSLDISNFTLNRLTFANRTTEEAQLQLSTQISHLNIHNSIEIARYDFNPVTIFVGPVPIVITPVITVNVGLDGKVSANITTNVTQQATASAELSYDSGQWSHAQSFTNNFQFSLPTISQSNALLKAYAGPNLSLLLYGVAGPYGEINGYTKLEAGVNVSPWYVLYGGLEALLGVQVNVLGNSLVDYNGTIFDYNKILAQSGTPIKDKILFESDRDGDLEIYRMNKDGTGVVKITSNTFVDQCVSWFPDGGMIAFHSNRDGNYEIYTANSDGSGVARRTNNSYLDWEPAVSPDGTEIAFISDRDGGGDLEIYRMNKDGTGVTKLTDNLVDDWSPSWSPDGNHIIFDSELDGDSEIYKINRDGSGIVKLTDNTDEDMSPEFSPDGEEIAFASSRDGNYNLYRMNKDGTGAIRLTYLDAVTSDPSWSPNGEEIVFDSYVIGIKQQIYKIKKDGTGLVRLMNNSFNDESPAWSPH